MFDFGFSIIWEKSVSAPMNQSDLPLPLSGASRSGGSAHVCAMCMKDRTQKQPTTNSTWSFEARTQTVRKVQNLNYGEPQAQPV